MVRPNTHTYVAMPKAKSATAIVPQTEIVETETETETVVNAEPEPEPEPVLTNDSSTNTSSSEIDDRNLIVNSFRTIIEMMKDRDTPTDIIESISDEELKIKLNNSNIFDVDINETSKVVYNMNTRVKIVDMLPLIDQSKIKYVMFVFKEKPNATVVKNSQNSMDPSIDVQMFCIKELSINISKHMYVPHHRLLKDKDQIDKILKDYQLKNLYDLPLIFKDDPMAKYLNAKIGNVVVITRNSRTSGKFLTYRYCV